MCMAKQANPKVFGEQLRTWCLGIQSTALIKGGGTVLNKPWRAHRPESSLVTCKALRKCWVLLQYLSKKFETQTSQFWKPKSKTFRGSKSTQNNLLVPVPKRECKRPCNLNDLNDLSFSSLTLSLCVGNRQTASDGFTQHNTQHFSPQRWFGSWAKQVVRDKHANVVNTGGLFLVCSSARLFQQHRRCCEPLQNDSDDDQKSHQVPKKLKTLLNTLLLSKHLLSDTKT